MSEKELPPLKPAKYVFGRPSTYTPELGQKILDVVSKHPFGLRKICGMYEWMPDETTIHDWLGRHEDFAQRYYTHREKIAHLLFQENLDEIDELNKDYYSGEYGQKCIEPGVIAAAKLKIAQRNYMAARLRPLYYGNNAETSSKDSAAVADVSQKVDEINKENEKEF